MVTVVQELRMQGSFLKRRGSDVTAVKLMIKERECRGVLETEHRLLFPVELKSFTR